MTNYIHAKPGDRLMCIDSGGSYTSYTTFFDYYHLEYLAENYTRRSLTPGCTYTVLYRQKHPAQRDVWVYVLIGCGTGGIYLCTDSADYLYYLDYVGRPWTSKSMERVRKIMDKYNKFDYKYKFVHPGYLFVKDRCYKNVPQMSTKKLEHLLNRVLTQDTFCF